MLTNRRQKAVGLALATIILALYAQAFSVHASEGEERVSITILYKNHEAQHGAMPVMQKSAEDEVSETVLSRGGEVRRRFSSINAVSARVPDSQIAEIEKDPRVLAVERPTKVYALLQQSVPLISANASWQKVLGGMNITGQGISVCVIDTGVDYTHPDLGGCFGAGCRIVAGYDFVNSDGNPMDDNGHGTHVTGIIAANGTGIKGVAPDAKIVAVKVLDANGHGDSSDVENGIDWCINNSAKYNITAISMSLGDNVSHASFCDNNENWVATANLINDAVAKNISVVVASGNYGSKYGYAGITAPACIQNATRVGATTKADVLAGYTNRGSGFPDMLLAPGSSINSTRAGALCPSGFSCSGNYMVGSGTSMATPHVSGAIALLAQAYRAENGAFPSPAFLGARLNATGKRIYDSATKIEFSRIDVLRALNSIIPPSIAQAYNNITKNSASAFSINEGEAVLFNASADRDATYSWYLGNTLLNATGNSFVWQTGYNDSGDRVIRVAASDSRPGGSFQWNVTVLDVPLAISSFYPKKNFTAYESSTTALNITASRDTKKDVWLIDGISVSSRGRNMSIAWNCTSAGNHNITYIGEDDFDSVRMDWAANITDANCPPHINPPLSSSIVLELQSQAAYNISKNVHDDDGDTLLVSVDDKNITVNDFVLYFNYSAPVANKTVTVFVNDSFSLVSQAISVTVADTIAPKISIISPENKTYSTRAIRLDFSFDEAVAGCGYALNNVSHTIEGCANTTFIAQEGWNSIMLRASDTSGNFANSTVLFFVDSVPPQIYFAPPNGTKDDFVLLSALISEAPSSCTLLLDGAEHRMEINGTICSLNLTGILPGQHNISIFANDSAGNANSTGNFSFGAYYCTESAGAWSSCLSAKRFRARILSDCRTVEESEPCAEPVSVSGGGGGSGWWSGESHEMKKQGNNGSAKASQASGIDGNSQKNVSSKQIQLPNSTGAQISASLQDIGANGTGSSKEQAQSLNKTALPQIMDMAGKTQDIVFGILSIAAKVFGASSGETPIKDLAPAAFGTGSPPNNNGGPAITGAVLFGDKLVSLESISPFWTALRTAGIIILDPLGTIMQGVRVFLP